MNWTEKTPAYGDIIRVKVKFYYHYGIFIDENNVIQFGLPDNTGIDPETIEVLSTDVYTFMNGGDIETATLTKKELAGSRTADETVAYAKSKLGTKGYNILHNNCEHFVNECVFSEHSSSFLNRIREDIRAKLKK